MNNRKVLIMAKLFNKYLKCRMQAEIKKNEDLEMIFQNIKKITVRLSLKENFLYYFILLGSN